MTIQGLKLRSDWVEFMSNIMGTKKRIVNSVKDVSTKTIDRSKEACEILSVSKNKIME
jgi:hypothetical protein